MSTTTRLLVLGVVRIFQPVHGYEVRRELVSWRAEEWASIKSGSIYNALKTLTSEGLLEVVGTDQVGGRPERTTYQLTSAGEQEFRTLLHEEWWTVRSPIDPLMAAVTFLGFVSRDEAIAALEHRVQHIQGFARHLDFATASQAGVDAPHHIRELHDLMSARVMSEIDWARLMIERLRAGAYATADDPPWEPAAVRPAPSASRRQARDAAPRAAVAAASHGEREAAPKRSRRAQLRQGAAPRAAVVAASHGESEAAPERSRRAQLRQGAAPRAAVEAASHGESEAAPERSGRAQLRQGAARKPAPSGKRRQSPR